MTTLKTNAIEPEGATTDLTIGLPGQNVVIGGSGGLKTNVFKDAGDGYQLVTWVDTGSTTWTVPAGVTSVEYLVVAGGGGGGGNSGNTGGGGGGAGGYKTGNLVVTPAASLTVTVGAGGAREANGDNSIFSTITSTGGGAGAQESAAGIAGGSGGGGSRNSCTAGGAASPAGQGNAGGVGCADGGDGNAGGGGAGAVGRGGASGALGGPGGVGLANSITGISVYSAGGGGGGGQDSDAGGPGGSGGGGAGANGMASAGTAGTNGTGGGGGGGGDASGQAGTVGGVGGDGIVVVKYIDPNPNPNTLFTSDGSGSVTGTGLGDIVLISSQTASNSASLSFTSGLTFTYKEYVFEFINIAPVTDGTLLTFQVNASGQSGYNEAIVSTAYRSRHHEDDSPAEVGYATGEDQGGASSNVPGTAFQPVLNYIGNDADQSGVGELHLFNPASTTYQKQFYSTCSSAESNGSYDSFVSGYIDVTAAITQIQFKMSSGNFTGKIKMYGIK